MTKQDITVAIAHRNNGDFLREAIESVAVQQLATNQLLRVLVVDDASDDAYSQALVCSLKTRYEADPRICFVQNLRQTGMACVRNQAAQWALAQAERNELFSYLLFVDADDLVDSTYVSELCQALTDNPELDFVVPNRFCRFYDKVRGGTRRGQQEIVSMTVDAMRGVGSIAAFRLSALVELGGWNAGFDQRGGDEGAAFLQRALKMGLRFQAVSVSDDAWYHYRQWQKPAGVNCRDVRRLSFAWCCEYVGTVALPIVAHQFFCLDPDEGWRFPSFWDWTREQVALRAYATRSLVSAP